MELQMQTRFPKLANERECTACLACENVCTKKAISHVVESDGHIYVHVDKNKCIGCLKCQEICNASRMCYGDNTLTSSNIYAAWAEDDLDRQNATSGGVFAAFASWILDNDGCVIGAELDGYSCNHVVIYDKKELKRLQGSKYLASSMEDVYRIIKKELPVRDVLFAGLGCQCAGVLAFFNEFKAPHKLYTIDLVCGGIPSRLLIDRFKEEYPEVTGIVSFRSKDKYELKVQTEKGEMVLKEKNLPLHGFNCGMTNRYSCYECQFAKAHRKTDITIGDLWDYSIFPSEHKSGISMVISHTQVGENLISSAAINKQQIAWRGALLHNKRIVCGHQHVYKTRENLTRNYIQMNHHRFRQLYTMSMSIKQTDLFAFRVYRYIREKKLAHSNAKYIDSIVNS